jgi:hypothetical protein
MTSPYDAMHVDATTLKMLIGGEWISSESKKTVAINNPSAEGETAFRVQGEGSKKLMLPRRVCSC